MPRLLSRTIALIVAICGLTPLAAQSQSQRPIQVLVPFSTGTAMDLLARALGEELASQLGQPVVILNREGAAGVIAFREAEAAQPDGHTLVFAGQSQLVIQPHVQDSLPYRPDAFAPVCQVFETPFAIAVAKQSDIASFADLVARARAKPKSLTWGHPGLASVPHLQVLWLARAAGIDLVDVPYRAYGQLMQDVIGGRLDFAVLSMGSFSGDNLRVLAVLHDQRSPVFPDAPTAAELGYPLTLFPYGGLFAPAATPRPALARLEHACAAAFQAPSYGRVTQRIGVKAEFLAGTDFAKRLSDDSRQLKTLIRDLSIKLP